MKGWTDESISDLKSIIFIILQNAMNNDVAHIISDSIVLSVAKDISETADTDFNDSDVRLAIGRVLLNRLKLD